MKGRFKATKTVSSQGQTSAAEDGCDRLEMVGRIECCLLAYSWRPSDVDEGVEEETVVSTSESISRNSKCMRYYYIFDKRSRRLIVRIWGNKFFINETIACRSICLKRFRRIQFNMPRVTLFVDCYYIIRIFCHI